MSNYDSNYSYQCCPYCEENITKNQYNGHWINDLGDDEEDIFQCSKCNKFFKVELDVYKEYKYTISKLTEKEIEDNDFIENKNKNEIVDLPGQTFMWDG